MNMPHHYWKTTVLLLICVCLQTGGCKFVTEGPQALIKNFMPPSPAQEARRVFNVYDADVRREALNNLSAAPFGGADPYVRLYRLLIDDPDPTVRAAAVKALGQHGKTQDMPILLIRLRDKSDLVRWEAAKAMKKIHNPIAIKQLIETLRKDEDADVRRAVAQALGQYPTVEVFHSLVGVLDDPRHGVAQAASTSLHLLTGENYGLDGAAWLAWQEKHTHQLFANQQVYTWQPYIKPRSWMSKIKFWKKPPPPPPPRLPEGADQAMKPKASPSS